MGRKRIHQLFIESMNFNTSGRRRSKREPKRLIYLRAGFIRIFLFKVEKVTAICLLPKTDSISVPRVRFIYTVVIDRL